MNITDRVVSKQRFFAHLRALAASKKTGTLIVTEPGVERRLYFEEGAIVAATSTLREESMGYLLAERDIVKAHKVEQAEELLGNKASLLGRKLVELGTMSEEEVGNAVRLKIRETIANILSSPEAEITLNDETFPKVDRVPVSIDVNQLLAAGIEAAERKVIPEDTEKTNPFGRTEEAAVLEPEPEPELVPEPEPEETLALPMDETGDPDGQLMQALEGFTEKYSREGGTGPRPVGPVTKPYSVEPELRTSSTSRTGATDRTTATGQTSVPIKKSASGPPMGVIAAGVAVLVLAGGGYWFFTRSSEPPTQTATGAAAVPSEDSAAPVEQPAEADSQTAETPEQQPAEVTASLTPQAAPSAPAPSPSPPPSRAPARPSASSAATEPRAQPAARRQVPASPPAPTRPARTNTEPVPEPEPRPSPPAPAPEPESTPTPSAPPSAEPPSQPAPPQPAPSPQPEQAPAQQPGSSQPEQGAPGNWGGAVFAPKQASVGSTPDDSPVLQTGDYVEPSFDLIEPVLIEHPSLKYPEEAKRQKIPEAVVRVRVLVDHTGAVQDAEVVRSAGNGFDEIALAAARQARFIPATKDSIKVKTWTVLPLVFRLED